MKKIDRVTKRGVGLPSSTCVSAGSSVAFATAGQPAAASSVVSLVTNDRLMSDDPELDDVMWRALEWRGIDQHRAAALPRLNAAATATVRNAFSAASVAPLPLVIDLAVAITRDLTAIGFSIANGAKDGVPGGVYLAPSLDIPGVIVAWVPHDAGPEVLGLPMHGEVQRQVNLFLCEILHTLGYAVGGFTRGGGHIVTGIRRPLTPADLT
jgi:hypothetical protein